MAEAHRLNSPDEIMIHASGQGLVWVAVCGPVLPHSPANAMTLIFQCADQSLLGVEISPGEGIAFVWIENPLGN